MKTCRALSLVMLCVFAAASARGQSISVGQIQGVVQDANGAVLPGVDVKVTKTDTGLVRSAVTGPDGGYTLPRANFGKIHVGTTGTAAGVLGQPRLLDLAIRYTF